MTILRRTFVLLAAGCILANGVDASAKGPRTRIFANLTATAAAPANAKGKAKFDQSASRTNFSVEAENLSSMEGKQVSILVNGTLIANTIVKLGRIKLELTNQRGGSVPSVSKGSLVELQTRTGVILSGSF